MKSQLDLDKEIRSIDISNQLFKHIEDNTLTEEILDEALSQDIDVDLVKDCCGWTLLMNVCSNPACTSQMVEKLIKAGADVNLGDGFNSTALFRADAEKAKILLKYGADVNHKNSHGNNALTGCAQRCPDMTQLLIESGIDVNNRSRYGENALFSFPDYDVTRLLVENGIDVHAEDDDGQNIMDRVCMSVDVEALKFLLKKGAEIKPNSDLAKIICDDEFVRMVRERIGVMLPNSNNKSD